MRPIAKKPKRDVVIQNWLPTDNARKIRDEKIKGRTQKWRSGVVAPVALIATATAVTPNDGYRPLITDTSRPHAILDPG